MLLGPGHAVYAAVDEKLNELLHDVVGYTAVYVDSMTAAPYRLHFYEITVRGQTTKGEAATIHAELVAVREEVAGGVAGAERFRLVPADVLIDLPEHPHPPRTLPEIDYGPVSDYVKTTVQMKRCRDARDERGHYADVACDYLKRSFDARVRAVQDRVMGLKSREPKGPEGAIARQRAEQDLADLEQTRRQRIAWRGLALRGPPRPRAPRGQLPSAAAGHGNRPLPGAGRGAGCRAEVPCRAGRRGHRRRLRRSPRARLRAGGATSRSASTSAASLPRTRRPGSATRWPACGASRSRAAESAVRSGSP